MQIVVSRISSKHVLSVIPLLALHLLRHYANTKKYWFFLLSLLHFCEQLYERYSREFYNGLLKFSDADNSHSSYRNKHKVLLKKTQKTHKTKQKNLAKLASETERIWIKTNK